MKKPTRFYHVVYRYHKNGSEGYGEMGFISEGPLNRKKATSAICEGIAEQHKPEPDCLVISNIYEFKCAEDYTAFYE